MHEKDFIYFHSCMAFYEYTACMLSHFSHVQFFETQWTVAHLVPLSVGFPGKNTGVGCRALLQGIFPTQGSNPSLLCLLHWQVDSLLLSHLGFPSAPKLLVIREFHQEGSCSFRTTSFFQKVRRNEGTASGMEKWRIVLNLSS